METEQESAGRKEKFYFFYSSNNRGIVHENS